MDPPILVVEDDEAAPDAVALILASCDTSADTEADAVAVSAALPVTPSASAAKGEAAIALKPNISSPYTD
jgi:hypothetical protein